MEKSTSLSSLRIILQVSITVLGCRMAGKWDTRLAPSSGFNKCYATAVRSSTKPNGRVSHSVSADRLLHPALFLHPWNLQMNHPVAAHEPTLRACLTGQAEPPRGGWKTGLGGSRSRVGLMPLSPRKKVRRTCRRGRRSRRDGSGLT